MLHRNMNYLRASAAVRALRADVDPVAEIRALVAEIGNRQREHLQTFADFRAENARVIADVVHNEKVDRINAALEAQATSIEEINAAIAALRISGDGKNGARMNAHERAYSAAFESWFRKGGDEVSLRELGVKASLSSASDPDGGFTVMPTMEAAIERVLPVVSIMRELATTITIGTDTYSKLFNMGGATSGWVGETDTRSTTTSPTLSKQDFNVMEIYAQPAATQKLLDDSTVNIEDWLANEVGTVFAEKEGLAFISGDGNNKPKGLLGYDPVAQATFEADVTGNWGKIGFVVTGAAADFAAAAPQGAMFDLEDSLKSGYQGNATFLMNRATRTKIRKFVDGNGNPMWQPSLQLGVPDTFNGKPVRIDDNMPNVGAGTFPIAYGDFKRAYLIVDRAGIRVLRDPFSSKPYVLFYTTKRVGGGVQNFEAVKLLKVSA